MDRTDAKCSDDRSYEVDLSALGVEKILKYGVAFSGKNAKIRVDQKTAIPSFGYSASEFSKNCG